MPKFPRFRSRCLLSGSLIVLLASFGYDPLSAQSSVARPVTLLDVVHAALSDHPILAASQARLRAALGARSSAGALGNPMLMVQRESGLQPSSALSGGRDGETMATATLPLDFLYQRSSRVAQANAETRSREAGVATTRNTLLLSAAEAYYRSALAEVDLTATQALGSWLDSLVSYQRSRVAEGAAAGVDLLRSELERDRVRVDIAMLSADAARARIELGNYLRDGAAAQVARVANPPEHPFDSGLLGPPTWQARPEITAARERLAAAEAGVSIQRRQVIPQVDATVGLKRIVGVNSLVSGFSLPLPLLNRNGGEIARARADRDEMAAELALAARGAEVEAASAAASARILSEQVEAFLPRPSIDSLGYLGRAEQARRIAMAAYREGGTSLVQLLDAAHAWTDARMAFYRTLYAQHLSVIALVVAQGGDLSRTIPGLIAPAGAQR